jgi:hypothetical protein
MLKEEGLLSPDTGKISIEDMILLLTAQEQDATNYVIPMIDANENINESEGGIRNLLQESNLIDIF